MRTQKGFTLIELVMVIVILGILAATALPRFVNMQRDAADAAASGIAGSISSSSAINYAASLTPTRDRVVTSGSTCAAAAAALLPTTDAATLAQFTFGGGSVGTSVGVPHTCTVRQTANGVSTYNATVIAVN